MSSAHLRQQIADYEAQALTALHSVNGMSVNNDAAVMAQSQQAQVVGLFAIAQGLAALTEAIEEATS